MPTHFPIGTPFDKTTKIAASLKSFLPTDNKHVLVALPTYWPITGGLVATVKGEPGDTVHDHFRALDNDGFTWMTLLTGSVTGVIPFSLEAQTAAVTNKVKLAKHFPKVPKGLAFRDSPYVTFTNVTDDDVDDCEDLKQGVESVRDEISDALLRLNPPPMMVPATPSSQPPFGHIDCDDASSLGVEIITPAVKAKRNLGKLRLITMGFCAKEGAQLHPIRESMADLFDLPAKEMGEAFGNLLMAMSDEQSLSTDYVNRQTAIPDWIATP